MPLAPYTGILATRCLMPDIINATNRQCGARSAHFSRSPMTTFKLIFPNWYVNGSLNETGSGSTTTITASVEYPAGTFTQVLFSGVATGTIANTSYLISDDVTVAIPTNTQFWVRSFRESTTGIVYINAQGPGVTALGNGFEMAVSGITDKTMGGSITNVSQCYNPVAIIGTTTNPSYLLIGDSIMWGTTDSGTGNGYGDLGPYARAVGPYYAYTKLARTGDTAAKFISGHVNRGTLFQYCSHALSNYGSNDLFVSSRTDVQLKADLSTLNGYQTSLGNGGPFYFSTILPRNQSTDGWQTLVNQSQSAPIPEGYRISVNAYQRAGSVGAATFDVCAALENSQDDGLWIAGPSLNYYTSDGTHPNTPASELIIASGSINIPLPAPDGVAALLLVGVGG